ncbi:MULTISPECIES: heavy-metal-associated domain-containing protein [Pseudomonas]|uniref:heavy-metal-associated domain-containing protein n=1 Tax=Pseudomonas TaxID=286 RepID=UPI0015625F3D|nr:heavy metal-associated domain-containing protein [Pseudomonas sp. MS19]NRH26963.1 heavy-metal-associated domain-containing protein [Pseudomonas sp. MS19]
MVTLQVAGMGCNSCVNKITRAVLALDQHAKVIIERAAGRVEVESDLQPESVRETIERLGFSAELIA